MTVIIFIIVLAVLIFVHELGHFLLAKANDIRVDEFKIGFGMKIFEWERGETKYGFNLIPFGGFVKIYGENPHEDSINGPDSERSFVNKNRWKQVSVLVAGVLFNFLFAWLLYTCAFASGVTTTADGFEKYSSDFSNARVMTTLVEAGSPAEKGGIKIGDIINAVYPVFSPNSLASTATSSLIESIQNSINASNGNPIVITYSRNTLIATTTITPVTGIIAQKYAIGIAMQEVADLRLPLFASIYEGAHYTFIMIRDTAIGLFTFIGNIFVGKANFGDVAGPIGIAGIVGNAARLGWTYLIMVTALISINLGVINLLPFPALDGGRVLFVAIEGIIRKRISPRFTNAVNLIGFILLMILMVIVTYKDIFNLIVKK